MYSADLAVLIGRFQPLHNGHLAVIRSALQHARHLLILIGSANIGRDTRNPFTADERAKVLLKSLDRKENQRISILYLDDNPYDNLAWIKAVQEKVARIVTLIEDFDGPKVDKIAMTGHERDQSSFYLRKFPQWGFIPPDRSLLHLNATAIRQAYFEMDVHPINGGIANVPEATAQFLKEFSATPEYADLREEYEFEKLYKMKWGPGPFQTVDNVVIQGGHVLVIQRKNRPGMGRLAIPGGHLELGEALDDAAVRELWEETRLFDIHNLSTKFDLAESAKMAQDLWPHFRARRRFDNPTRSRRAHVITEAFLFKLPDTNTLPAVIGSDDAQRAFWLPLSEIRANEFFEDHAFIINKMIERL